MSRGMSRGGSFPIIIAVLGTLIVAVIAIFVYLQFAGGNDNALNNDDALPTPTLMATPTPMVTPTPSPVPTAEPTPTPAELAADAVEPTATIYNTPPPVYASATVWANSLKVRADADLSSPELGKVRREEVLVVVDETSKWLKIEYNGGYGWVWADYCVRGGASLPAAPADADFSVVSSWGSASGSSSSMTVTIKFSSGVYSDEGLSGAIQAADFSCSDGTISGITNNAIGTESVTLTITPNSGKTSVTVSIKKNSVYTSGGKCDDGSSHKYSVPGTSGADDEDDTDWEGAGAIDTGDCSDDHDKMKVTDVVHSEGDTTADVTIGVKSGETVSTGQYVTVTVKWYTAGGDSKSTSRQIWVDKDSTEGTEYTETVNFGKAAYGGRMES